MCFELRVPHMVRVFVLSLSERLFPVVGEVGRPPEVMENQNTPPVPPTCLLIGMLISAQCVID